MDVQLQDFIRDLIYLIKEKYNETLEEADKESETDRTFRLGCNIAYYNDLDLIESQLKSFGIDTKGFGIITPVLGKKISENNQ
jgi:hypothetical protein